MVLRVPSGLKFYLFFIGTFVFILNAEFILRAHGDILISDSLSVHAEIPEVYIDILTDKDPRVRLI